MSIQNHLSQGTKTVIVMVGLPARGKSTIAEQICRCDPKHSRIFNAGQKRRQLERAGTDASLELKEQIFDMADPGCVETRDEIAMRTLVELLDWLQESDNHKIGIFDATNSTLKRRKLILSTLEKRATTMPLNFVFLEVIVDSKDILEEHLYWKVRHSDDYKHLSDKDWCLSDFQSRMRQYEAVYETIDDQEISAYQKSMERPFSISILKVRNRFDQCFFYGEEAPAFIHYMLFAWRRRRFLETRRHLATLRDPREMIVRV